MADMRHRNLEWNLGARDSEGRVTFDVIQCALLMDLRDELRNLNRLLNCQNFVSIPATLRSIRRNTTKPKRKKP